MFDPLDHVEMWLRAAVPVHAHPLTNGRLSSLRYSIGTKPNSRPCVYPIEAIDLFIGIHVLIPLNETVRCQIDGELEG